MTIVESYLTAAHKNWARGTSARRVRAVVVHVTDGPTAEGAVSWFHNPACKTSAHDVVDRDGSVTRIVRPADVAFHAGARVYVPNAPARFPWWNGTNPNHLTIGIEHAGRGAQPWTDAMYEGGARLTASYLKQFNLPCDPNTVFGHRELLPAGARACPGLCDLDRYRALVAQYLKELK